ncbi:MAG: lipid-A-disaccharide synthase [Myxococcaceae bacterium]|nr:lipid-A-disaccharide synthase [Myxococcaceae bacterium]
MTWVMVVAGEASGDQHAAAVVAALRQRDPSLRFFGMGGPRLGAQGVELVHGAHEISVMGIVEVLPKVPRIWRVLGDLARAAEERRPAAALLIDVPDFNLRLAKRLKRLGIPIAWYVAPMAWAWRESRVEQLRERVDQLLCILPFEEKFFRDRGVAATYVGSPVLEQMPPVKPASEFRAQLGLAPDRPTLAVLPGSRRSELSRLLPTLVEVARRQAQLHPGLQVVVPIASGLPPEQVRRPFEGSGVTPRFIDGQAPEVVGAADVAVVASGTATLEAALMHRPLVAVYRVSPVTYLVGRTMLKIPFVCLVNLLAGRRVVPELLQGDATPEAIVAALEPLWSGPARTALLDGLDEVRAKLGQPGAAGRVADAVLKLTSGR